MTRVQTAAGQHHRPPPTRGWVSFVGSGPGDPGLLTVRAVELLRECRGHRHRGPRARRPGPRRPRPRRGLTRGRPRDRRRRLRRGRPAADPRGPRQGRRTPRQEAARRPPDDRRPVPLRLRTRGGAGLRQGRRRLRGRPRRLLGQRGPGLRRHPADHQAPQGDGRRHLRRRRSTGARTPTTARSSCSPAWAASARPPTALIEAGRSPETPVAMTRVGTTTEQHTLVSTLADIAADVRAARIAPPAITVIGDVVDLRETLSWFETKPLFGWRVLVPRTKEQAGSLSRRLRELRRRARGGADHLGRAAAQPAPDGQGRPRPRRGPLRVDRLHLGQRGQGRAREVRGVRPRRPRVLRPEDRRGRRQDRRGDRRLGPARRPRARPASSPLPACSRTGRRTTTCSTRSTGSSCRAPTSPPRTSSPA